MADDLTPATADTPAAPETTAPETAPARIDATTALEQMSEPERRTWREKGDLPERIQVEPRTDPPDPAKPVEKTLSKRQLEINEHVRARTAAELKAKELEAKIAAYEKAPPAREPVAPPKPEEPTPKPDADREPVLDDFLDQPDPYLSYTRAIAKYDAAQVLTARETERETRTRAERDDAEVQRRFTAYQTRETALKAKVPDFDAKTQTVRHAINLTSPLGAALLESPVAPELILHFAEHPDDFQRIGVLGVTNLPTALRELGKLEARFEAGTAPASAAPAPKTLTSAPPPPTTLGTHTADAADDVESARRSGDVGAYIRAQNARDLAAARK